MIEKLKIIPTANIMSFESSVKERSDKLAQEIHRDGKLRNPLLVRPLKSNYLLLDDVAILSALTQLQISHVPVQLADPCDVSVHAWQRLIKEFSGDDLVSFCKLFPRQLRAVKTAGGSLGRHQMEVRFRDGARLRVSSSSRSPLVRADICRKFYEILCRNYKTYRAKVDFHDSDPLRGYADVSAVLFPPVFTLDELAEIAARDVLLPQGFARVDQPGRVLGIDYALSILNQNVAIDEKESFLHELLRMRMSSDRIAYYNGAVIMFNS
jgi:hypothetical protein